jgi:hypothetical protein
LITMSRSCEPSHQGLLWFRVTLLNNIVFDHSEFKGRTHSSFPFRIHPKDLGIQYFAFNRLLVSSLIGV